MHMSQAELLEAVSKGRLPGQRNEAEREPISRELDGRRQSFIGLIICPRAFDY